MRQIRFYGWEVYFPMFNMWIPMKADGWEPVGETKRIEVFTYDHEGD